MLPERYIPKKISEAKYSKEKFSLVGTVADVKENSFILKDGDEVEIEFIGKPQKNKFVRVFCSVDQGKIKADIVQSLDGVDTQLFKKVEELYNKAGV